MKPRDLQAIETITTQIGQLISESADAGGYIDTGEVFEAFNRWNDALVAILDRHDDGPPREPPTITPHDLIEIRSGYAGHAAISAVTTPAPGHVQITIIRPTDGETRTDSYHREENPPKGYAARWSTRR